MKMYPDGVVEGSPEELAAFKHIDAALTKREQPALKALPAPRRKRPARAEAQSIRQWAWEQGYAVATRGALPLDVVDAYHARRRRTA